MSLFETTATDDSATLTRRHLLVAGGAAGVAAVAGCSGTIDLELDDVIISNDASHPVSGSITVQDPTDETVLDETFDLSVTATVADENVTDNQTSGDGNASDNETAGDDTTTDNETAGDGNTNDNGTVGGDTSDPTVTYTDTFTESGDYAVAIDLDAGSEIRGESGVETEVTVSDTDEQSIVVGLDSDGDDIAGEFADSDVQLDAPIWVAVSDGEIEFDFTANESNNSS